MVDYNIKAETNKDDPQPGKYSELGSTFIIPVSRMREVVKYSYTGWGEMDNPTVEEFINHHPDWPSENSNKEQDFMVLTVADRNAWDKKNAQRFAEKTEARKAEDKKAEDQKAKDEKAKVHDLDIKKERAKNFMDSFGNESQKAPVDQAAQNQRGYTDVKPATPADYRASEKKAEPVKGSSGETRTEPAKGFDWSSPKKK